MHSFVILMVYLAMLLSPCIVAQWGDLLVMPRWNVFGRRRRARMADPVFAMMEEAQAEAALRAVMREAFVAPAALPGFGTAPATLAEAMEQVTYSQNFAAATARVGARLAQLAAARKAEIAAAAAVSVEDVFVAAPVEQAVEVVFAVADAILDSGSSIRTPTAEELEAMVGVPVLVAAPERSDSPPAYAEFEQDERLAA